MKKHTVYKVWEGYGDLLLVAAMIACLGALIYIPLPGLLILSLGLLCVFFVPGYVLLAALYPGNEKLSQGQRLTASLGLSVVSLGLLLLAVTFTFGITRLSSYLAISGWVLINISIASYRRFKLKSSDRHQPNINRINRFLLHFYGETRLERHLCMGLFFAFLLVLLAGGRLLWVTEQTNPQFSEFYLVGENGLAADYPASVLSGEFVTTTVGIINHEGREMIYGLAYQLDNRPPVALETTLLADGKHREYMIDLPLSETLGFHKVGLFLWDVKSQKALGKLYLWVNKE